MKVWENRRCPRCGGLLIPLNPLEEKTDWVCVDCVKEVLVKRFADRGHCKIRGGGCVNCG
jgi:DNA-directed RNA polymerase subunit RPC12/RpoP